jgi:hypothetical protein
MDVTPIQFYSAIGAIVAALIGGFLSLFSLVTSKEQKLSELRHEWISDFRKELAELIAEMRYSSFWADQFLAEPTNAGKNPYITSDYKTSYLPFAKAFSSLRLRLNPNEANEQRRKLYSAFLSKMDEIGAAWKGITFERAETLTRELRDLATPLLQSEWKRIEEGNAEHRVLKGCAIAVLSGGLVGVILLFPLVRVQAIQGQSQQQGQTASPTPTPTPLPIPPAQVSILSPWQWPTCGPVNVTVNTCCPAGQPKDTCTRCVRKRK